MGQSFFFCCSNNRPDRRDLLGIADATRILQRCNLVLVESFSGGEGSLTSRGSHAPHLRVNGLAELHHVCPY